MIGEMPAPPDSGGTLLLVGNFAPDEGFAWWLMENFWVELAEIGRQHGLEPLLIYRDKGVVPESIRQQGITTAFLPFLVPESSLERDLRLVRRQRVRFIYLTDRPFLDPRYALLRGVGVRRIVTHDHVPGDRAAARGLRGLAKSFCNRLPLIAADRLIAVSPFVRERAIRSLRIPPTRVSVVQNGIRPLSCNDYPADYARREFGIPDDHTLCVMAGRAHKYKRVDFLIEVARRVRDSPTGKQLTFLFCGDGPDLDFFKSLAEDLGRSFIFAGRRQDLPAILWSSDIAVHPSQGEAFSLAIVEYMSARLPVVVPDIASVSQAIDDGRTGLIYRDGDATQVASLLLHLHHSPRLRKEMGEAASRVASTRYSLREMNRTFRNTMAPLFALPP